MHSAAGKRAPIMLKCLKFKSLYFSSNVSSGVGPTTPRWEQICPAEHIRISPAGQLYLILCKYDNWGNNQGILKAFRKLYKRIWGILKVFWNSGNYSGISKSIFGILNVFSEFGKYFGNSESILGKYSGFFENSPGCWDFWEHSDTFSGKLIERDLENSLGGYIQGKWEYQEPSSIKSYYELQRPEPKFTENYYKQHCFRVLRNWSRPARWQSLKWFVCPESAKDETIESAKDEATD